MTIKDELHFDVDFLNDNLNNNKQISDLLLKYVNEHEINDEGKQVINELCDLIDDNTIKSIERIEANTRLLETIEKDTKK